MSFSLQNLLTLQTGDYTLLESVAAYFDSKVEKTRNLLEMFSSALAGEYGEVIDELSLPDVSEYSCTYYDELSAKLHQIPVEDVLKALISGVDKVSVAVEGVAEGIDVEVQTIIDQLTTSYGSNIAMVESLKALATSGSDTASALMSDFIGRMQLRMSTLSETASGYGYAFLGVLTSAGQSVGDKVRALLSYVGMYSVTAESPDIGLPESDFTRISGSNVYQAWLSEVPQSISELWEWLKETIAKVVQVMSSLLQSVLGSNVWKGIVKFMRVLTTQTDAYSYTNSTIEEFNGFSDFGSTLCWNFQRNVEYDTGTVLGSLKYVTSVVTGIQPGIGIISIGELLQFTHDNAAILPSNINSRRLVEKFMSISPVGMPINDYLRSVNPGLYPPPSNSIMSNIELLLDYINNQGEEVADLIASKLTTKNYLEYDLPCSRIYLWIQGSKVFCRRIVAPVASSISFQQISSFVDLKPTPLRNPAPPFASQSIQFKPVGLEKILKLLRRTDGDFIELDSDMWSGILKAYWIDSLYLTAIYERWQNDDVSDFTDDEVCQVSYKFPSLQDREICMTYPNDTMCRMLGYSIDSIPSGFFSVPDGNITGVDIIRILCGKSVSEMTSSHSDWIDLGASEASATTAQFLCGPLLMMLEKDFWISYVRTTSLPSGRYKVMTVEDLSGVLSSALKVVAVAATVVFALKLVLKLKRAAYRIEQEAWTLGFNAFDQDEPDFEMVTDSYKLQRKANIINGILSAVGSSVGRLVTTVKDTVTSTVTNTVSMLRARLSGTVEDEEGGKTLVSDATIYDVMRLIK